MDRKIGFMGLGIMGSIMSAHVVRAGYDVLVYNRTRRELPEHEGLDIAWAESPRDLAEKSDIIILMLTGPEASDALLFGEQGAAQALTGKTLVNMSTVSAAYSKQLAARLEDLGCAFCEAPVSGSRLPAEKQELVILAGGEEALVKELEPLLLTMGKKVVHCGAAGNGAMMKLSLNLLLGVMMTGFSEAADLAEKGGLPREAFVNAVLAGPLNCGLFTMKKDMLLSGDYPAQFPLKHMAKDLAFAVGEADAANTFAPLVRLVSGLFRKGVQGGLGDDDFAAIAKILA